MRYVGVYFTEKHHMEQKHDMHKHREIKILVKKTC